MFLQSTTTPGENLFKIDYFAFFALMLHCKNGNFTDTISRQKDTAIRGMAD